MTGFHFITDSLFTVEPRDSLTISWVEIQAILHLWIVWINLRLAMSLSQLVQVLDRAFMW